LYRGFYINLDRAVLRREQMEQRLADAGLAGRYERFCAIDGRTITYGPEALPGSAALGCTLSHLSLIKSQQGADLHIHILEDDAVLHPEIGRVLENFVALKQEDQWDVLMTDIFVPPDVYLFKHLHKSYRELSATGSLSFFDIGTWEFACASSYFVNKNSIEKFVQMMEHQFPAETPYDLRIRELAKQKMLKVFLCFPFFSTVSELSTDSNIAGGFQHVLPLTEYRRSFYVSPDFESISRNLARYSDIDADDPHMRTYMNLIRCLIAPEHAAF